MEHIPPHIMYVDVSGEITLFAIASAHFPQNLECELGPAFIRVGESNKGTLQGNEQLTQRHNYSRVESAAHVSDFLPLLTECVSHCPTISEQKHKLQHEHLETHNGK